jgi:hypothetical protein
MEQPSDGLVKLGESLFKEQLKLENEILFFICKLFPTTS